ncbi:MAG TPA: hypothetical protein VGB84_09280 [Arachidicoccus sp.]
MELGGTRHFLPSRFINEMNGCCGEGTKNSSLSSVIVFTIIGAFFSQEQNKYFFFTHYETVSKIVFKFCPSFLIMD